MTETSDNNDRGSLSDMSLSAAKRAQAGDQATFNEFSGNGETTYIAVTRSPDESLEECVDEVCPDLGPPWYLFNEFISLRNDYMDIDGLSKEAAHNKAWEESEYSDRFSKYLWWDDSDTEGHDDRNDNHEPRAAIIDILDRIDDGENIVLVCYCKGDMHCHRKMVRADIEQWMRIMERMKGPVGESTSLDEMAEDIGILLGEDTTQLELSEIEP